MTEIWTSPPQNHYYFNQPAKSFSSLKCKIIFLYTGLLVFFWTFPSSGILETKKHDVSETGSVSVLRWEGEKTPTQLGPLERANLNHWTASVCASYVTTDGQPASLSWSKAPIWGLRPDLIICVTVTVLFLWGTLSDERSGLSFVSQSFSGPSPLGLETIFYCLTFETSLFVASYDSQGHGGGIRPRLHTGQQPLSDLHSYLITRGQANSVGDNKKIHNKNCDKARTCVELG
jgi:hypothetical protein